MARLEQISGLLGVLFVLSDPLAIKALNLDYVNYDLAGRAMAANDQLIVGIQNRSAITFSAVGNYAGASPQFCSLTFQSSLDPNMYAMMIAVGRTGTAPTNVNTFVFAAYSPNITNVCLVTAIINFNTCQLTSTAISLIAGSNDPEYSVLGVDPSGQVLFYFWDNYLHIQSPLTAAINSAFLLGISSAAAFIPIAVDIRENWGVLAGYMRYPLGSYTDQRFTPYVHFFNFADCFLYVNASCLRIFSTWQMQYFLSWQTNQQPPVNVESYPYNPLYDIAVSINDADGVLVGIHSVNTVFRFAANGSTQSYIERRLRSLDPISGYGKAVSWIASDVVVILANNFSLDYTQFRSSSIEFYPITTWNSLSIASSAYVTFPNTRQSLWPQLNSQLIDAIAVSATSSLMFMDLAGLVHVIRPSGLDLFVNTRDAIGNTNCSIYLAPLLPCRSGTIKNLSAYGKDIFRYCVVCPEGTFKIANQSNGTNECVPCHANISFCPLGSVAELPMTVLDPLTQLQFYPRTPENDVLEDILLINVFSVDFSAQCMMKQPTFWAAIILGVGCLFLLFMGILKLTHKCRKLRRGIKSVFKQTDLIGEGELWIGGVASLAILVMCIFAYRFSSAFLNQYPIETAGESTFACDPGLVNAKFSTSMQSLVTPLSDDDQPLFDMLDQQPFILSVTFINTDFSDSNTTVSQIYGAFQASMPYVSTNQLGLFGVQTNLSTQSLTIQINVSSDAAVGGVRVGLTGPSMGKDNYQVKEVNFSYVFSYPGRTLTQDPIITLQLVKLVNETSPLSSNDKAQYSAMWIPTYQVNYDQMFYTEDAFQMYHIENQTVLTIQISEASYFIHNLQEPITKLYELIFTNILFTTMCIELFALVFLFFKLAILPMIRALMLFFKPPDESKSKKTGTGGGGCSYCRPIDPETLPAYNVPVQRAQVENEPYAIRRSTPISIGDLQSIAAPADLFSGSTG